MSNHPNDQAPLLPLSLAALGVVYGDIGTSPLYAMREVFASHHYSLELVPANVIGILSIVFWSVIVVITLKYITIMMRADNKGEGGIMALMALALRKIPQNGPHKKIVLTLGLIGASLFYGDGVITPAISVLSAVEGISIITPTLEGIVIPLTIAILVSLFLFQRFGTSKVGTWFGPIMLIWFSTLALLGLANIIQFPSVLMAINPLNGFEFFIAHPTTSFLALGAVVLVLTGGEALYADMGHFGRKPIQVAWIFMVMPALLLNYFGQGALLLKDPAAISNPFYHLAPSSFLLPLVCLATISTIIASQAVITGAFSVTRQAILLNYAPRLETRHTSADQMGQIYLPAVNWTLLVCVIALVLGFGSSSALAGAYGIAVTGTMITTSCLAFVVAHWLWRWPIWKAAILFLPFLIIDITFFASNTIKIIEGGWFPLVFGLFIFIMLTTWKMGREHLRQRIQLEGLELKPFIESLKIAPPHSVAGNAIYMTSDLSRAPQALLHSLKHFKVLHETVVFLNVQIEDVPRVAKSQRLAVEQLSSTFWSVRVHFGFMDETDIPAALEWCSEYGLDLEEMQTTFFLNREMIVPIQKSGLSYWREKLFASQYKNANSAANQFQLPTNRIVELGTQVNL